MLVKFKNGGTIATGKIVNIKSFNTKYGIGVEFAILTSKDENGSQFTNCKCYDKNITDKIINTSNNSNVMACGIIKTKSYITKDGQNSTLEYILIDYFNIGNETNNIKEENNTNNDDCELQEVNDRPIPF